MKTYLLALLIVLYIGLGLRLAPITPLASGELTAASVASVVGPHNECQADTCG